MPRVAEPPDKLLDLIYDAATEQELWRSVLTEIADHLNSQGGVLFGQSFAASKVYFDYNGRLNEDCNRAYKERHFQNPWNEAMAPQPVGRVVFSDEVVALSSLRPTLFFEEVLRPQDLAHNAMIALTKKRDFLAAFNICRSERQGPFGEDERRFLERLVPHMRRSIQLEFRLEGYRALQRASFDILDRLSDGLVLLDRRGRILYLNAAARAFGADDGVLVIRNETVALRSASHSQRHSELFRSMLNGAPACSMSVPRPADGRLVTLLMSSLRGRDIGRFADLQMPDAAVLLVIIDPANRAGVPMEWIMDAYGLTQAEARIALAMSAGGTTFDVAGQLGLSPNTVKTHLRRAFAKTGTGRQTELARLFTSIGVMKANGHDHDA